MNTNFIVLDIKVIPNRSPSKIIDWEADRLKVAVAAPPEKGKANYELIKFLAKEFHVSLADIDLLTGESSRIKKVKIRYNPSYPPDQILPPRDSF
jgi:uncharacterized protein (TIGR00251 family)